MGGRISRTPSQKASVLKRLDSKTKVPFDAACFFQALSLSKLTYKQISIS